MDGDPMGAREWDDVPTAPLCPLDPGLSFREAGALPMFRDDLYKPTARTLLLWAELDAQASGDGGT